MLIGLLVFVGLGFGQQLATVNVPVADLRATPQARPVPVSWEHDENQVLFVIIFFFFFFF